MSDKKRRLVNRINEIPGKKKRIGLIKFWYLLFCAGSGLLLSLIN